jgi:hypothetical protein
VGVSLSVTAKAITTFGATQAPASLYRAGQDQVAASRQQDFEGRRIAEGVLK